jgi:hypothetical protein
LQEPPNRYCLTFNPYLSRMRGKTETVAVMPEASAKRTPAAKLHVLHLAPIKEKLGAKWPKLSEPVHRLFEKSIREAQGPRDHFIQIDELSYVVTFNGRTFGEATLACAAIAKRVCDRLFGETDADVAVRALVGQLSEGILATQFRDGSHISQLLELIGHETVVSSDRSGNPAKITRVTLGANDAAWDPIHTIGKAQFLLHSLGLELGLFPFWELAKAKSACLYACAYPGRTRPKLGCTRQALSWHPDKVVDAEIAILYTAHAYAHRVHGAQKVCALGAAVSYETLSSFNSRIRYITALKSLTVPPECPILLKLDSVPPGTPLGRLAELVSMLSIPNLRITIHFESYAALPDKIDIRLGAAGIGCTMPPNCDELQAGILIKKLMQASREQKGFIFVQDLDTLTLAALASSLGVRFGTGRALSEMRFSGIDQLPHFPLSITAA